LHFFGFPLYENIGAVDNDTLPDVINEIKGYFLYVGIDENRALVANDIAGGFRTYTGQVGDTTYLSDDYSFILDQLRDQAPLEIDEHEYEYWEKHCYTTGGATFVRRCHKLPPASMLTVDQSGIKINSYFRDVSADTDATRHSRLFVDDLSDTLRSLDRQNRPIFLFLSGGNDSTLLMLMMRELKIDFTPIFVKLNPSYPANEHDGDRARGVAHYLGLTLKELDISLANVIGDIESIACEMLFDRHLSLLHFGAARELTREFGSDVIIVGRSCCQSKARPEICSASDSARISSVTT
jgi:asparagine synthetase B (glutamine-hydrolysing)